MAIKVEHLFYTYSKNTVFEHSALQDVNLEFKEGSFSAIVGQTGSGKSSLIQHFNGILQPESGQIIINNFTLKKIEKKKKQPSLKPLRKEVGLVFQFSEYQLFEESVIKDVMFGPKNFGISEEEAHRLAVEALQLVGIDESLFEVSPFDLSGGQKRRVAIAGVLAINPDIIVLDEPTAGLDPQGIKDIMKLFTDLNKKQNKTIILVSHDMNVVYEYANQIILMNNGKVITVDNPVSFFNSEHILDYSIDLPTILLVYQTIFSDLPNYFLTFDNLISLIEEEFRNAK